MVAKPRVSESQVNFEALWQTWPEAQPSKTPERPRLLGEARERKLFNDHRYLPNVIARIRASQPRHYRRKDASPPLLRRTMRVRTHRQKIAAELGLVFSTCTLAQARRIIADCNKLEKQALLDTFFSLQHWRESRLGQEIAPALRKRGL